MDPPGQCFHWSVGSEAGNWVWRRTVISGADGDLTGDMNFSGTRPPAECKLRVGRGNPRESGGGCGERRYWARAETAEVEQMVGGGTHRLQKLGARRRLLGG